MRYESLCGHTLACLCNRLSEMWNMCHRRTKKIQDPELPFSPPSFNMALWTWGRTEESDSSTEAIPIELFLKVKDEKMTGLR